MKKQIKNHSLVSTVLLIFMLFSFSCKKEDVSSELSQSVQEQLATVNSDAAQFSATTNSVVKENYAAVIFDSCRSENVNLNGLVTYTIKESYDKGYSLSYIIDLTKVIGVGENTGIIWRGGGKITGVTSQSVNGLNAKGRYTYRVTYSSQGGKKLSFNELGRFIQVNNVIKKETGLQSSYTCN